MRDELTEDTILQHLPSERIRWRVHSFGAVGSTNSVARRLADGGAPEGSLVVAETQTTGRGREGKPWHSPVGGLWFSFVLRPHLPSGRAGGLTVVAALAVALAVRDLTGLAARIKWPNDVYAGGSKLAGVMMEAGRGGALVVGVGLNVNVPAGELPSFEHYRATSLLSETGQTFARPAVMGAILGEFESRYFMYRSPDHHELLDEWRELSLVLGERVSVITRGESFDGTVFALEDDGGIVVRLGDGRQAKLLPHEDVSLIPIGVWRSS